MKMDQRVSKVGVYKKQKLMKAVVHSLESAHIRKGKGREKESFYINLYNSCVPNTQGGN